MKWLAHMLDMEYGKVKRILSESCEQQLSLSIADRMLMLLGSNLREVIARHILDALSTEIQECINKYDSRKRY